MNETAPGAQTARGGPAAARAGTALCLSGGGYRAALFHLGAVRRLNEHGVLSGVDLVSAVSGGSILAAHLADRVRPWPAPGEIFPDWEDRVAVPFREFCSRNIRTGPFVRRLAPWNWFGSQSAVDSLADAYEKHLTAMLLPELPRRPEFVFCSADMYFGVNWTFSRERVGDYRAGYLRPAPDWPVARAVAASSCFPPFFNPMRLGLEPEELRGGTARGPARDAAVSATGLTDGGVYDNLGLEPAWKSYGTVLVSDGGGTFDAGPDSGFLWRLHRYTAIVSSQAAAVRKRWLIARYAATDLRGAYWGIAASTADHDGSPGYSEPLVSGVISRVRTDLDRFSDAEQAVLENHGYLVAESALRRWAPHLVGPSPAVVPHPEWLDEDRVRDALRGSARRKLPFGRR